MLWKELNILNKNVFDQIQDRVDRASAPSDIGKIPNKIESGFDGFTADQWKNWTLIFSLYALSDVIPSEHLNCWRLFVIACYYMCSKVLTTGDIVIADQYLMKFCYEFERLYGKERVKPNMHLSLHLRDCISDFGPIYSFWCFSFERYNGMLGALHSNNHNVEIQIMEHFLRGRHFFSQCVPKPHNTELEKALVDLKKESSSRGTLKDIGQTDIIQLLELTSRNFAFKNSLQWVKIEHVSCPRKSSVYFFSQEELRCLNLLYSSIYTVQSHNITVSPSGWTTKEIFICNEIYGALTSRSFRSSAIAAFWPAEDGSIQPYESMYLMPRVGLINYFQ